MYNIEFEHEVQVMRGATPESAAVPARRQTRRIEEQLLAAQTAIHNVRAEAEIMALLAIAGLGETQLVAGEALLQRALGLQRAVQQKYGQQYAATDHFHAAWQSARQHYSEHPKRARLIFEGDRETANSLRLSGIRRASFAGWLDQARHFYDTILETPAYGAALAQIGITEEGLRAGQAAVEAAASAKYAQQHCRGEALHSTRLRRVALTELTRWMGTLRAVARAALAEKPRYLQKLGIRSSGQGVRLVESSQEEETTMTTGGPLYAQPVGEAS